jgi:hypothetical protein
MPISLATDHQGQLAAHFFDFFDFLGERVNGFAVNAELERPGENLAGDLENNALVFRLRFVHGLAPLRLGRALAEMIAGKPPDLYVLL